MWKRDKKEVKRGAAKVKEMEIAINFQNIIVFLVFVGVVFILYKTFKLVTRAVIIAVISFAFPWIVKFLKIPIPINADINTGVQFMFLGLALFLIYEFWHVIKAVLSLILKPLKLIFKRR